MIDVYWTGMWNPKKSIMRAPARMCSSWIGVSCMGVGAPGSANERADSIGSRLGPVNKIYDLRHAGNNPKDLRLRWFPVLDIAARLRACGRFE